MDCGEPVALSVTETEALKLAAESGVKLTVMVQLAPAASEAPQVFAWAKSAAPVPVIAMLLMVSAALPPLVRVAAGAVIVEPTAVLAKGIAVGFSVALGVGLVAAVMVKVSEFEVPPPGEGLVTVTAGVPAAAISEARITAVSWPEFTKVVARGTPLKFTDEVAMKFDPLTVSVN